VQEADNELQAYIDGAKAVISTHSTPPIERHFLRKDTVNTADLTFCQSGKELNGNQNKPNNQAAQQTQRQARADQATAERLRRIAQGKSR
jgi:hypothetical protein